MGYEIGQVVPIGSRARIVERAGAARWYALVTRPQREGAAQAWLRANGVECWYPTETRWRVRAGRRVPYLRRIAPGYLFALFGGVPCWSVLFGADPGARWLRGVVGRAGAPLPIPLAAMAAVEGLPQRLMQSRADMLARAAEVRRVVPGDRVRVREGAFEGCVFDVAGVHAGVARLVVPMLGNHEVSVPLEHVARTARA